jgi:hypothetical protein
MSYTIADFLDVLETMVKFCLSKCSVTICLAQTFLSKELNSGQYNTTSIGSAFLTLGNIVVWATTVCFPLVAKHVQNDISEFLKIWHSILKIAIKCTTLCFINVRALLELLSGVLPCGD